MLCAAAHKLYTQVSIKKLQEVHEATHPAKAKRTEKPGDQTPTGGAAAECEQSSNESNATKPDDPPQDAADSDEEETSSGNEKPSADDKPQDDPNAGSK